MPYQLKTISELAELARSNFRQYLKGSDGWVWPNNVYASAKVMAGTVFEIMGYASYIKRQIFAHTSPDIESLLLHGEEYGIPRNPAVPASGPVQFNSAAAISVIPGAVLRREDGVEYLTISGGSLPGAGSLILNVTARLDGKNTNAIAGTPLEVISGVTGTATAAVAAGGVMLGADVEDIESYRARILFRKRNPPHGGAPSDYVFWSGQVAGVSFYLDRPTVFVERLWQGPGTVRVFPLMFDLYPNGIPQAADVARVRDYLETVKPAGAKLTVAAPVAVPVNISISNLVPLTDAVKDSVRAELAEMFVRLSRVAGTDQEFGSMPFLAYPTSFSRSWIWQAIANATGETRHKLVSPADDIPLQPGEMATLGTINFV